MAKDGLPPALPPPLCPYEADPDKETLNRRLEAFLEAFEKDRASEISLANLTMEVKQYHSRLARVEAAQRHSILDHQALVERVDGHDERLDSHGGAIILLKRRVRTGDDDKEMQTGKFDLQGIQREVEEQKAKRLHSERVKAEQLQWWHRQIFLWAGGGVGAICIVLLTVLITLAIRK